ncbi:MAG: hypothetical protein GC189_13790 [Alphaproteobacteria bacterium]|nr:hypothetical protein [Alphaproteobacteria bacterium]
MNLETLTPVWGDRYVDRLLDFVVPAWLSPGNIPALSKTHTVRVNFLTAAADAERILTSAVARRLSQFAEVICTPIDDLIAPGSYSVPLTLAFHRGLAGAYRPGAARHCILLNADFVISDGALRAVVAALANGARIVQATSLRVVEDQMRPRLRRYFDADGALQAPARALVGDAFDALHPTVLAARADQCAFRSPISNQFYWRVDADTMISRPFLFFALALTVDAPPPPARSYADYGMAEAIAGRGAPVVTLTDSEAFLAIELAPETQEQEYIERGALTATFAASHMSSWSTEYHRRQGQHVVTFHKGQTDCAPNPALAHSDAFVEDVLARLGTAQSDSDHPNWLAEVRAWRATQARLGRSSRPSELPDDAASATAQPHPEIRSPASGLRRLARVLLVGPDESAPRTSWQPFHLMDVEVAALLSGRRVRVFAEPGALGHIIKPSSVEAPAAPTASLIGLEMTDWFQVRFVLEIVRTSPSADAYVFVLTRRDGGAIGDSDVLRLWSMIDGWAEIVEARPLNLDADFAAARSYGRLADTARPLGDPIMTVRLLAGAVLSFLKIIVANARPSTVGPPGRASGWILRARSR